MRIRRLFGMLCLAGASLAPHATAAETEIGRGVGQPVAPFSLTDSLTGRPVQVPAGNDVRATVIVFTGIDCPVGDLYWPRLNQLAREYRDRGVAFVGVNSNHGATAKDVAADAREVSSEFPVLLDPDSRIANALQAERTCEALVIDSSQVLRYRGAIDDQYGLGFARQSPTKSFLREALDSVIAGKNVDTTASSVVGCPIERGGASSRESIQKLGVPERVAALVAAADRVRPPSPTLVEAWKAKGDDDELIDRIGSVDYVHNVAPIVRQKCAGCHRPGEAGPFPLLTFDDAKKRLAGIQEVVDLRRMPPWHADPRYGHFENDRSLSPSERATVLAWVEQGAPRGEGDELPPPSELVDGWKVGKPDMVFEIPADYTVPAEGAVGYQRWVVPTGFTEDQWIQSAEARPTDPSVVHHIIVYVIEKGKENDNEAIERSHLCGYAPGDMPSIYPLGTAKRIPAGSSLLFELHYTPNGKVRVDRSKVGLVLARAPVERLAYTLPIFNERIQIPPSADNHRETASMTVKRDMRLLAFMPHMHLRGKAFTYRGTIGGGKEETLLSVPAYDFAWQSYYRLAQPIDLKKGDRIACEAFYDNSASNPVNPDPSVLVKWGDQTWEEMMIGYIDVSFELPPDRRPKIVAGDRAAE